MPEKMFLVEGDQKPDITFAVTTSDGEIVDLSDVTTTATFRYIQLALSNQEITKSGVIALTKTTDGTDGRLTLEWGADSLDTPGDYEAEIELDFDGVKNTTPHLIPFTIRRRLNSLGGPGQPGDNQYQIGIGYLTSDGESYTWVNETYALASALALKANLSSPTFTGTVSGITKSMVGLGSVDNTSDAGKPVSTAQQTALDLKANIASPTFTGTVGGITKSMVGLGNCDDTSDATKLAATISALLAQNNTYTKAQRGAFVALTSASASIAVDLSLSNNFNHTLTEDTTLAAPTNAVAGQSGVIHLTQHASSPKTLGYNAFWKFAGGTDPTLTATNGAVDVLSYVVNPGGTSATCVMLSDVK